MQQILIIGELREHQIKQLMETVTIDQHVTVYAPAAQRSAWPQTVTFLAGHVLDTASLTAVMLEQDLIFAQLPTKDWQASFCAIVAAGTASQISRLIISSSQSVLTLSQAPIRWYQVRHQRQQLTALKTAEAWLQHSQLDFVWIQGTTAADTTLYTRQSSRQWATAVPAREVIELASFVTSSQRPGRVA